MSLRGYFIAGTDTGVGKTRVTVALLGALRAGGTIALGMKAVASGTDAQGVNEDVALIRAANALALAAGTAPAPPSAPLADNPYCFPWPISPHLAAERGGVLIDSRRILRAARSLAAQAPAGALVLVEGTGGWLAPISPDRTMADIAVALGLPVVLVVGVRLGCLNHALLSARAIAASGLSLAGWIGSHIEPQMLAQAENLATLERWLPAPRLGLLPHDPGGAQDATRLAGAARMLRGATPSADDDAGGL